MEVLVHINTVNTEHLFLAHLAFRPCELLSSLFVRLSTFHILIFSSETTGPIATKLWWDGPLPKLCPVIPTSNQDGHQAKNRKKVG
jgi:hypothetical protein